MTSFCECDTCKEIKKRILNPRCSYCDERHDPRVHCIAEMKIRGLSKVASSRTKYINDHSPEGSVPTFRVDKEATKEFNEQLLKNKPCPACGTVHDEGRIGCPDDDTVQEILKETSEYCVTVDGGKYFVYQTSEGSLKALRYGEQWRDLTGDNLVFHLMVELVEAREKLEKIKGE